jgi:hypothetical protein
MRSRLLIAASVTALLLAACGGGDDSTADPDRSTSTTEDLDGKAFDEVGDEIGDAGDDPVPVGDAPDGCKVGSGNADDLESLMPEPPDGFRQESDDVGDTGPSDFAKAARDDGTDEAAEILTDAGFLAGYQRLWSNNPDEELILFVYEFCDDAGAQRYLDASLSAGDEDDLPVEEFDPAGLPDAYGELRDEVGSRYALVALVHDGHIVIAHAGTFDERTDIARFEDLATDLATETVALIDAA